MPTLLERLGQALWGREQHPCCDPSSPALKLVVRCARCGELIQTRIEKAYEVEAEYDPAPGHPGTEDEEPKPIGFTLHKEMLGTQCQQLVQVELRFGATKHVVHRQVDGGELVEITDCE